MLPLARSASRSGQPRVIMQGLLDRDATVYELFPMQTFVFDGAASTTQSIPMPVFETNRYARGVLSVMMKSQSGFGTNSRLRVRLQNAVRPADDPTVVFAEDEVLVTVQPLSNAPVLLTGAWTNVGPSARLRFEWSEGTSVGAASVTLAVWLTLRSA